MAPISLVACAAARSKAMVLLLLIRCLLLLSLCGSFVFGPCFVMQYLVYIISLGKRELVAFLYCLPAAMRGC